MQQGDYGSLWSIDASVSFSWGDKQEYMMKHHRFNWRTNLKRIIHCRENNSKTLEILYIEPASLDFLPPNSFLHKKQNGQEMA